MKILPTFVIVEAVAAAVATAVAAVAAAVATAVAAVAADVCINAVGTIP